VLSLHEPGILNSRRITEIKPPVSSEASSLDI